MSPRHLITRHPVARKIHQCWECTRPIEPGTVYRVDFTAYEGRTYSIKAHIECADAGMALARDMDLQQAFDEGRDSLIEEITASGEPLTAFDLPDVVRRRLEDAIAEGEARRDALEEAAQQCEGNFDSEMRGYGDHFAASIRALKGEGNE